MVEVSETVNDELVAAIRAAGFMPGPQGERSYQLLMQEREIERLRTELGVLQQKYDALLTAALDYWHDSVSFDTPSGQAADNALTALLGGEVET